MDDELDLPGRDPAWRGFELRQGLRFLRHEVALGELDRRHFVGVVLGRQLNAAGRQVCRAEVARRSHPTPAFGKLPLQGLPSVADQPLPGQLFQVVRRVGLHSDSANRQRRRPRRHVPGALEQQGLVDAALPRRAVRLLPHRQQAAFEHG